MLRKALICCMLGLLSAVYVPAASWAGRGYELSGDVPTLDYRGASAGEMGFEKFAGTLVATGAAIPGTVNQEEGRSWMVSYESETGEYVYLYELVAHYEDQDSVIIFSQDPYFLDGGPEESDFIEPNAVGFYEDFGLLNDGKKVSGNCYFTAFINVDGDAGYYPGEGFYGEGDMLIIYGSARLDITGYPDFFEFSRFQTLIERPDIQMDAIQIKSDLLPASAFSVYVYGEPYIGDAEPVAVELSLGTIEIEPYFCCW